MEKPTLEDFGLTQNDVEIYRKQDKQFREEYERHVKSIEKISFLITWAISTLIVIIVMLIADSKIFEEKAWVIWIVPVGSFFFPNLLIAAIMDGPYKFLDRYDEIKTKHINKVLENKYFKYQEALQEYERYVEKTSRDYWINMSGIQFEKEVASLFRSQGYSATVTSATGDGGVDIILIKGNERIAVQCKHHSRPVGPNDVRALQGVVAAQNFARGIFVSLNGYTTTVYGEVKNSNVKIELLELKDILKMPKCFVAPTKPTHLTDAPNLANLHIYDFVLHKTFGEGIILAIENRYVTVDFSNFVKKFVFPNAFLDGYLTLETDDTRVLGEYSFKKYWLFAKHTWNNIKFKNDGDDYSYLIKGLYRIMEIEDVDFKGLVINFESIRPEYYNGGKRFDISEKEGLLSSISVFTSFLEFIREARLSVDGFKDFLVKEATDNEIYLANKQGDNESNVEFIINRKIRLEKVKVEHIGSYIMLVQNIMEKEKIDIIELGKYSVSSNIDDLILKYSTADVPSSETILKWFKMYYRNTISTV